MVIAAIAAVVYGDDQPGLAEHAEMPADLTIRQVKFEMPAGPLRQQIAEVTPRPNSGAAPTVRFAHVVIVGVAEVHPDLPVGMHEPMLGRQRNEATAPGR